MTGASASSPSRPQPPPERGRRLASFPRGRDGDELRIHLDEYEVHPYLFIRVWNNGFPVKGKGVSVRLGEARGVAEALLSAVGGDGRAEPGPWRAVRPHSGDGGIRRIRGPLSRPK